MKTLTLFLLVLLVFANTFIYSQWSTDPENPGLVCDMTGIQNNVKSVPDDNGGAYVFWLDSRSNPGSSPREIYGQHYDNEGYALWEPNGRLIWNHYNSIPSFDVVRNSNGTIMLGIITQSLGAGSGDSLSFRMLDNSGEATWEENLVVANAASLPNYILYITSFKLIPAGSEYYVLYEPTYYGGANGVRYTRFDSNGNLLGQYDGVPVGNQSYIGGWGGAVTTDGTGDFILYHSTGNGSGAGLQCYRFSNNGTQLWGPVDVLQNTTGLNYKFAGLKDDNGMTFVWQGSGSNGSIDLFARRLTLNGAFAWNGTTVNICTADGSQDNFDVKQKDENIYVSWADGRPGVSPGYYDIYAQKLDTTGYQYWMPDGIEIASFNTYIPFPMLVVLDDNSIIVDHQSNVSGFMAQMVDPAGNLPWGPEAIKISSSIYNPFYQMHNIFQSDESTIAVWNKAASGGGADGVYISRIDLLTALDEQQSPTEMTISPNPASDYLQLRFPENVQVSKVFLYTITGQIMVEREINTSEVHGLINLETFSLSPGPYFVRAISDQATFVQKVIVQ